MKAREDAVKSRDAELEELGKTLATERSRLEELERKVKAREADLHANARVLAEDRMAFADLEERSRKALKTLYEHGLERPLTTDEDSPALLLPLLAGKSGDPPDSFVPLYRCPDGAETTAAMPVFDGRGLVPPAPSDVPVMTTPVVVSSDEEEEQDSAATPEGSGETSPLRRADFLRTLPDDDDTDNHPVKEVPPPAGVTTRSGVSPSRRPPPGVPTKGSSVLISRGEAPAVSPPGAATASSTPGARAPVPQAARPPGSTLLKRRPDYAAVDQPSLKKKKEEAATSSRSQQPGTAAPPLAQKGGDGARASLARSSSRGPEERLQERATPNASSALEALVPNSPAEVPQAPELLATPSTAIILQVLATMLPPSSAPPSVRDPSASPDVLEHALSALTLLREDLQGTDHRLVAGRLELISGWLHSYVSVRAALSQAAAASKKDKQAVAQAAAVREAARKDAGAAQDRCRSLEAELEAMRNERAVEARGRKTEEEKMKAQEDAVRGHDAELEQLAKAQATEHSRLEKLEQEMKAKKAELEAKAKVLAEDRVAFKSLEEKSHAALRALYEKGLEEPLATDDKGPTQLLPHLVAALEDVVDGIGPLVEGEAHALSSAALTRVFSHLHLRDPDAYLDELLEPVDDER
nr:CCR4-NOT transcription complex subunit 3-like [Aegilops tauschii subsp. strangulata]